MTIKIYSDRIEIGNHTLFEGAGANTSPGGSGLQFTGRIKADAIVESYKTSAYQGSNFGYSAGGAINPGSLFNTIDKFPFASATNATDVGDITVSRRSGSGHTSKIHGYVAGGWTPGGSRIDKWPFASDTNAVIAGTVLLSRGGQGNRGTSSQTHGYISGGWAGNPLGPGGVMVERFSFFSDTPNQKVADLLVPSVGGAGISGITHGYHTGGAEFNVGPGSLKNSIQKYSFSSDITTRDIGDLTQARSDLHGHSSTTHGYSSGGDSEGNQPTGGFIQLPLDTIDKFPFATDTNATDVGNLITAAHGAFTGISSTGHGYRTGGGIPPYSPATVATDTVDRFSFASDGNAVDYVNLSVARRSGGNAHY